MAGALTCPEPYPLPLRFSSLRAPFWGDKLLSLNLSEDSFFGDLVSVPAAAAVTSKALRLAQGRAEGFNGVPLANRDEQDPRTCVHKVVCCEQRKSIASSLGAEQNVPASCLKDARTAHTS